MLNHNTTRKCKFILIDSKFSLGDITNFLKVLCLAYNMNIRTPRLTVAEKTSKLESNQFLIVTDVRYVTLYAKTEFQTNVSKAKRTTNANMDNKRRKAKMKTNATLPFWSGNFLRHFLMIAYFNLSMPWSTLISCM